MTNSTVLSKSKLVGFIATRDQARAKIFYRDVLGFRLVSEDQFATVFDANGTTLRVTPVRELMPAQYTVLAWEVVDITAAVASLGQAGVKFEQYGFPTQDAQGIWTAPDRTRVAWFKDPDNNILGISQH